MYSLVNVFRDLRSFFNGFLRGECVNGEGFLSLFCFFCVGFVRVVNGIFWWKCLWVGSFVVVDVFVFVLVWDLNGYLDISNCIKFIILFV